MTEDEKNLTALGLLGAILLLPFFVLGLMAWLFLAALALHLLVGTPMPW